MLGNYIWLFFSKMEKVISRCQVFYNLNFKLFFFRNFDLFLYFKF